MTEYVELVYEGVAFRVTKENSEALLKTIVAEERVTKTQIMLFAESAYDLINKRFIKDRYLGTVEINQRLDFVRRMEGE